MKAKRLSVLGLSNRATHVVYRLLPESFNTTDLRSVAGHISNLGVAAIEAAPDAGGKTLDEIRAWVEAQGMQLSGDVPKEVREELAAAKVLLERWGYKVTKAPKR